jgi:outer membrane putative beta-barrel porin/alpha-amylase
MATPTKTTCLSRAVQALEVAAILATAGCASAEALREPITTDRPDFTESTITVKPGIVQIEGGHTFERVTSEKTNTTGELLLRIGLASRAELRIEPGSYTKVTSPSGDASGWEDGALGMKVRLDARPNDNPSIVPDVSLVAHTSVPTGGRTFRQNRLQPEVKLAAAWTITDRLGLSTNFNVARPVDENGRYTELAASASFGFDLTSRLGAFAEVFGFAPQLENVGRTHYLDTGLAFGLTPNFQLDVRGGVGLNGAAPDYFVGAGIGRRW